MAALCAEELGRRDVCVVCSRRRMSNDSCHTFLLLAIVTEGFRDEVGRADLWVCQQICNRVVGKGHNPKSKQNISCEVREGFEPQFICIKRKRRRLFSCVRSASGSLPH